MNAEYFPHFMRSFWPDQCRELQWSNDDLIELGEEFKRYLQEKFKGKEETLKPIWDNSMMTIIRNQENPLRMKGYHPAFLAHFQQWVEIRKKELT